LAYSIQWRSAGVVKFFTGDVSFHDVIKSEREITGSSKYTSLRYLNIRHLGLSEAQLIDVRALRLGGHYSNPRIKYAFVTDDVSLKETIEKSVVDGQTLHATKVFKIYEDAMAWAIG
jgi:hypothetical protein